MPIRFFKSWNAMLMLVAVFSFFSWILRSIPTIPDRTALAFNDKEHSRRLIIFSFRFGLPGMVSPGIIKTGTTERKYKMQIQSYFLISTSVGAFGSWESLRSHARSARTLEMPFFIVVNPPSVKLNFMWEAVLLATGFEYCAEKGMDPFLIS